MLKINTALKGGALRSLKSREGLIDLASNDYLGLSRDSNFQKAAMQQWERWSHGISQKTGATGSRLLTGNHRYFEETEEKIAHFHGFKTATIFNCGYMANLGLLASVCTEKDTIIADLNVHASIHDGIRLSKARSIYFRHNNVEHLENRLKSGKGKCFVVIESLYSMGGDRAPLLQIVELCQRYCAHLIVDEAHAIGVIGNRGEGLVSSLHLQERVFACMGAFGKALGAHGAVLMGSCLLKKVLINFARSLIYTTALPLSVLAEISCCYDHFPKMHKERDRIAHFCSQFSFPSHIHSIPIKGVSKAKLASLYLASKGFDVRPIFHPTVPKGEERLRLIVHAFNEQNQIQRCLDLVGPWRNS